MARQACVQPTKSQISFPVFVTVVHSAWQTYGGNENSRSTLCIRRKQIVDNNGRACVCRLFARMT